jgi:hypothetical protein
MNDVPFDVNVDVELGDMSGITDVLEPAARVRFKVKQAELNRVEKDGVWKMTRLKTQLQVGDVGVDGNGKYAGKVLFGELIVAHNPEVYTKDWWKNRQYLMDVKQFIKALGYDVKAPPTLNDQFLGEIIGREVLADIKQVKIQAKKQVEQGDGTVKVVYVDTDDVKNEVGNFKSAE